MKVNFWYQADSGKVPDVFVPMLDGLIERGIEAVPVEVRQKGSNYEAGRFYDVGIVDVEKHMDGAVSLDVSGYRRLEGIDEPYTKRVAIPHSIHVEKGLVKIVRGSSLSGFPRFEFGEIPTEEDMNGYGNPVFGQPFAMGIGVGLPEGDLLDRTAEALRNLNTGKGPTFANSMDILSQLYTNAHHYMNLHHMK